MNKKKQEMRQVALQDIKDTLQDDYNRYLCDLHGEVFNTDYYVIGTFQAKEELKEFDVFEAIELVTNYEKENFGEIFTDMSDPEKLINMVYYIIGSDVVWEDLEIGEYEDYNEFLTDETRDDLIRKIDELLE